MKKILILVCFLLIVCLAVIYFLINQTDPYQATNRQFFYLYTAITLFLTCLIFLFLVWLRSRTTKNPALSTIFVSFRQAFLIAAYISITIILYTLDMLSFSASLPIALAFIFLELFFLSEKRPI